MFNKKSLVSKKPSYITLSSTYAQLAAFAADQPKHNTTQQPPPNQCQVVSNAKQPVDSWHAKSNAPTTHNNLQPSMTTSHGLKMSARHWQNRTPMPPNLLPPTRHMMAY